MSPEEPKLADAHVAIRERLDIPLPQIETTHKGFAHARMREGKGLERRAQLALPGNGEARIQVRLADVNQARQGGLVAQKGALGQVIQGGEA